MIMHKLKLMCTKYEVIRWKHVELEDNYQHFCGWLFCLFVCCCCRCFWAVTLYYRWNSCTLMYIHPVPTPLKTVSALPFLWNSLPKWALCQYTILVVIIIITHIYHALIDALSAHMIHINLNTKLYPHVVHIPTKTIYIKYYMETHTHGRTHTAMHTHTYTLTVAETGYWYY